MAVIMKDQAQEKALEEIEDGLKLIRQLNQIESREGVFSITFTPNDGKSISVQSDEEKRIRTILQGMKEKTIRDIKVKKKTYRIALSKEEALLIGEGKKKEEEEN